MLYRVLAALLLPACMAATTAWGQKSVDLTFGVEAAPTLIDAETSLGLQGGLRPSVNNAGLFAAAMSDTGNRYPIVFSGNPFVWTQTVVVPSSTGWKFLGNGVHRASAATFVARFTATLGPATRHIFQGLQVEFDGTTKTATTSAAGATITLTGSSRHVVAATDVGGTLWITGGNNFIANTYTIVSVDTADNRWTLDRAVATDAASGLVGYAGGTLWQDRAFGSIYDGFNFQGKGSGISGIPPDPDVKSKAAIGVHCDTNWERPAILNRGKQCFSNGSVTDCHVGFLFGTSLREFGVPDGSFYGETNNNADVWRIDNFIFAGVKYGIVVRTNQAIGNVATNLEFFTKNRTTATLAYIERGSCDLAHCELVDGAPTLLRIGRLTTNQAKISVDGARFDASCDDGFRLLEMDESSSVAAGVRRGTIDLRNIYIAGGVNRGRAYSVPIATVAPSYTLRLTGCNRLRPGAVKLLAARRWYSSCCFLACEMEGCAHVEDVVDDNSDKQTWATFVHCHDENNVPFPDGRFVVGKGFASYASIFDALASPYRFAGAPHFLRKRDDVSLEVLNTRYRFEQRTGWGLAN